MIQKSCNGDYFNIHIFPQNKGCESYQNLQMLQVYK
jgi:hypothetical protein